MIPKRRRGGKRTGAGRPSLGDKLTERKTVRLWPAQIEYINALPGRGFSAKLRRIVDAEIRYAAMLDMEAKE